MKSAPGTRRWLIGRATSGGEIVTWRFLQNPTPTERDALAVDVSVSWPIGEDAQSEQVRWDEFEDALESLWENERSLLVAVIGTPGHREWIFRTNSFETWIEAFNRCLSAKPRFPISITHTTDPSWNIYEGLAQTIVPHHGSSSWTLATADSEARQHAIRFRAPTEDQKERLPREVSVTMGDKSRALTSEIQSEMVRFEAAIEPLIESELSWLAAVFSAEGYREWCFYTLSADSFMRSLNEVLKGKRRFSIVIRHSDDPEWAYFEFLTAPFRASAPS